MTNTSKKLTWGRILCRALRILLIIYISLSLVAIFWSASWDLKNYIGAFVIFGSPFLGGVTILWNLIRFVKYRTGMLMREGRFERVAHEALLAVMVFGIPVFLLMLVMSGVSLGTHVIVWETNTVLVGFQLLLFASLGIRAILRRIEDHRRAEAERLEEERLAWEGYLF